MTHFTIIPPATLSRSGVEQRSRDLQENFPKSTGVCPFSYLAEWKRETAGPGSGEEEEEEKEEEEKEEEEEDVVVLMILPLAVAAT
ncbi:unnamed protein product [Lota lota]